jgi:alpha-galactosidase
MKSALTVLGRALLGSLCLNLSVSAATLRLDALDLGAMSAGWGKPAKNQAVTGKPMGIGGQKFQQGVGTHAFSECPLVLDGKAVSFSAQVGVDDNTTSDRASIEFIIQANDREVWRSGLCRKGQPPRLVRVDLAGVTNLSLVVTDAEDGVDCDHANWAEAVFEFAGQPPRVMATVWPPEEEVVLTPAPPPAPRLHGPRVYGVRPNAPFLYRIPCTGERPMTLRAEQLPAGLTLDPRTGILRGRVAQAGTYRVSLLAENARGTARRDFRIVVGPRLALTPPMGWNSWYIHYHRVSERIMREAADQMIATGMADFGYQYVNIDDCWMVKVNSNDPEIGGPTREAQGRILPNKRFPDIRGMTDAIHAKGLKAGIYIGPGPTTCAGYEASWQHEALDARTFAEWGFDFLKYDWCSYSQKAGGNTLEHLKTPYQVMWAELQKQERDIVHNLCQYGMGEVWKWGCEVGHCWRTTGDLGLERGGRLPGFYNIGFSNARHHEFAKPGCWNDPDYLLVGWVGDAHGMGEGKKTTLTPNEQYSYMAMWCLMAAPLIFSGDMAKLDPFTLNILCNHEVIEVDQDPLGQQARIVRHTAQEFVLVKDMEDGSKAVGLFNLAQKPARLTVTWRELKLAGKQRVRDLWRQTDIAVAEDSLTAEVPRHGVSLVRLWPAE